MAKINGGKGFETFDHVAHKLEQEIIRKENEELNSLFKKRGRPRMTRVDKCVYCGDSFPERTTDIDLNDYDSIEDLIADHDDSELERHICTSCKKFWSIDKYDSFRTPYPGWTPKDALDRINKVREAGYALILKNNSFGTPSGNKISIELGDVFEITRAGVPIGTKGATAIDKYSIDIMVGTERLRLFPWEFGTITWIEIMTQIRLGELTTVYLGSSDVIGYSEHPTENSE